jgi:hypothetical protein
MTKKTASFFPGRTAATATCEHDDEQAISMNERYNTYVYRSVLGGRGWRRRSAFAWGRNDDGKNKATQKKATHKSRTHTVILRVANQEPLPVRGGGAALRLERVHLEVALKNCG